MQHRSHMKLNRGEKCRRKKKSFRTVKNNLLMFLWIHMTRCEGRRRAIEGKKQRRVRDFYLKASLIAIAQTTNFLANLIKCMTLDFTPH